MVLNARRAMTFDRSEPGSGKVKKRYPGTRNRTRRIGFAIAVIGVAVGVVPTAPATAQSGGVGPTNARPGWIGISFGEPRPGESGVVVQDAAPEAPAARAGIRAGDRIVRWNGRTDVSSAVRETEMRVGSSVRLSIVRAGESEREIVLVAAPRPPRMTAALVQRAEELLAQSNEARRRALDESAAARQRVLEESFEAQRRALDRRLDANAQRLLADSLFLRADSMQQRLREILRDSIGLRTLERLRLDPGPFARRDAPPGLPGARARRLDGDDLGPLAGRPLAGPAAATRTGVAGAEFADLTPGLAGYFGAREGALVLRIAPATPADRSGLEEGDVVVAVAGTPITSVSELRRELSRHGPGVELDLIRQGSLRTITLDR